MMINPLNVFIIDDEFPRNDEFRRKGVYNSAISKDNLYHLAVNDNWNHLVDLQQLIIELITSQECEDGLIELYGFSSPTQVLITIEKGLKPDVIIFDWEYTNSMAYSQNSSKWLLEILERSESFIFIYSKLANEIQKQLSSEIINYVDRIQLFSKGYKVKSSFSSEEFILQYIVNLVSRSGHVKISGVPIKFTSNNYLEKASDILFLQRVLGFQYIIDAMNNIDFTINQASVEKLLNDSELFLFINREKKYLVTHDNILLKEQNIKDLPKLSYLEVIKEFSKSALEETIERGVYLY
jgi:hypothetical protein